MPKYHNIVEEHPDPASIYRKQANYNLAQNIILYGPPGTGKTFHSLPLALSLVEQISLTHLLGEDREKLQSRARDLQAQGQLLWLSFHQGYGYEEFVQGLRPNLNAGQLLFEQKNGVFKEIALRARQNYEAFIQKQDRPRIPFDDLLNLLFTKEINPDTEEITLHLEAQHRIYKAIVIFDVNEEALLYRRLTKNDLLKQEERRLSLHKLRALYQGEELKEAINLKYYQTVVDAVKRYESNIIANSEQTALKQYVVLIDEINRANLAQVFGELITLLEPDKRLGMPQATQITLASGEYFALPPNLHLIGTMNSQDYNTAWLDTATQRRFRFWAMYPQENLIQNTQVQATLKALNQAILAEKNSPDYLIGHAPFMEKSPAQAIEIIQSQVLPLLQQYFPNNPDKLSSVFQQAGIRAEKESYQWRLSWLDNG